MSRGTESNICHLSSELLETVYELAEMDVCNDETVALIRVVNKLRHKEAVDEIMDEIERVLHRLAEVKACNDQTAALLKIVNKIWKARYEESHPSIVVLV
jgi:SOS response regulatory protein OraA/RecX